MVVDEDLKKRIENFVFRGKHVTSAKLAFEFGRDFQASMVLDHNLVAFPGISAQVGEALSSLMEEKRLYWSPISLTAYYLDGFVLDLPVTYVKKPYDILHWMPTAFNTPRTHHRLADAIKQMGVMGNYPKRPEARWVNKLLKMQSSFECDMCGKCCTVADPITLEPQDVERISAFLGISIRKTIRKYATSIASNGNQAWMMKNSKPCAFYDPKNCSCRIHSARPFVCRAFPFLSFYALDGHLDDRGLDLCPSVREHANDFLKKSEL